MSDRFFLPALGIVNALGSGAVEVAERLFAGDTSGLVVEDGWLPDRVARVGMVRGELPDLPDTLALFSCRTNRLLMQTADQIKAEIEAVIERCGRHRVGIVLGTSTSGIAEGEVAVAARRGGGELPSAYRYTQQELGTPAAFLSAYLGITGPAYVVSTACTSSAKAFVSARNLLRHGLCDAVLVGGADSLCKLTVNGFAALESTSIGICNPMSRNRNGINIGEGAALFLMTRDYADIEFIGAGESSDAHHMSAPHPEGVGAETAMRAALADARLDPADVDYLNMHATATVKNDEMEAKAMHRVFGGDVPASGTKPMTGHLLGAAGATELAFCWLALQADRLPPHVWDGEVDPGLPSFMPVGQGGTFRRQSRRLCMSNSFAFGGSNATLLIGDRR
ncbi:beta-ketoacyl-[acyl-carrier-protein] synthase family protein [Propionivibrio soli]|uniref:beta-ketoacyl-[acyl-carrier-protein] synthase family protein n=1 Tax=Propionivibrio soli TaxID=2976531 RepID=UPI0021E80412|nr:beta-ketoacyl-[acyl-carrier-protein] synthase family protein [Propionivibrio soli]